MECPIPRKSTSIDIKALDAIINVNSLFTLAVFIGLAWNPYDPSNSLVEDTNCYASPKVIQNLISFHVLSFSSFLFSSLIAQALKQAIRLSSAPNMEFGKIFVRAHVHRTMLRVGIMVSAAGSLFGCGFLMLALVNVVQVKLGSISCRGMWTMGAIVPLVILVPIAMVIYTCIVLYAVMMKKNP
ncbi:hypothetical protein AMTRI_Chr08g160970 [Amborella trichopoda]|uniref:uncharacterized protein LOC105421105 n=1 Tax=Amborella trichopoda TaxID=13333 RepID=UPI0005D31E0B|nr:uncharacterized protein LOC105421105 [Amborella trichopoda]XP_011625590.1 uncharacterized protein LOC105421105 [Amborella trichopoda]|eukprot:XP_011625589.1 uncharacterized protein LOC105421105 [Amborella trichopoda]